MDTQRHNSGFIRTEWAIAGVVLAFLVSIFLRILNIWIRSDIAAHVANIIAAVPAILIVVLIFVYIIMQPFINRRIAHEWEKINKEEPFQQSSAGDAANRTIPEK